MEAARREEQPVLAPEELARQSVYAFLARTLAAPPTVQDAISITPLAGNDTALGVAFVEFAKAFENEDRETVEREYHDLFIGVGRGELLPYGSYYLTGFLHEKPLADLRRDHERLGIARAEGVSEPEDHIASLCETMALLIDGTATGEFSIYDQEAFFRTHIQPWAEKFFDDLSNAETARLYSAIGGIGGIFMTVEEDGFRLLERA